MEAKTETGPTGITKVKDLTPQSNRVNVLVKVTSVGEAKEIPSKFGEARKVAEARVGDETGSILLSLWQDQIGTVGEGDVLSIENGYISLVQGHMRLNVGKYGKMTKSDQDVPNVNMEVDVSAAEHEGERRPFRPSYGGGGRGYGGGGRGGYGGRRY